MKCLLFLWAAYASGASLADLQVTARELQARRTPGPAGEPALLNDFKHQLRDWVESRLPAHIADPVSFSEGLNEELHRAALMCPDDRCENSRDYQGYLDDAEIRVFDKNSGWLFLKTAIGTECGYDESVYLYERAGSRWARRLNDEQDQARVGVEIELSSDDIPQQRLALTTGISLSCASVWQEAYYRLYRLNPNATTLLELDHPINIGEEYGGHRLETDGLVVEIPDQSIDQTGNGMWTRPHVLRYKIDGDRVRRVEPIALRPVDFVDEWLTRTWPEIAEWSDPALVVAHEKLRMDFVEGEYASVIPCAQRPGVWQIVVDFDEGRIYFLVQEQAQYSYRMLDVSETRQGGCPGETVPDFHQRPTLFSPK